MYITAPALSQPMSSLRFCGFNTRVRSNEELLEAWEDRVREMGNQWMTFSQICTTFGAHRSYLEALQQRNLLEIKIMHGSMTRGSRYRLKSPSSN